MKEKLQNFTFAELLNGQRHFYKIESMLLTKSCKGIYSKVEICFLMDYSGWFNNILAWSVMKHMTNAFSKVILYKSELILFRKRPNLEADEAVT